MGSTVWIEVRGRGLEETASDSNALKSVGDELDKLAGQLGVVALSHFYDWSEMDAEAEAEICVIQGRPVPDRLKFRNITKQPAEQRAAVGTWFDSTEGLRSVQAIGRLLVKDPQAVSLPTRSHDVERYHRTLIQELKHCEDVLLTAVNSDQPFRLLIVP